MGILLSNSNCVGADLAGVKEVKFNCEQYRFLTDNRKSGPSVFPNGQIKP